jgi:hypothetical protein
VPPDISSGFDFSAFRNSENSILALTKNFQLMSPTYELIDQPMPSSDLLPHEVVMLQLKALQRNDERDDGIEVTFNFASPGNKAVTGPLSRYKQLVRNPLYEPIINFRSYRLGEMVIEEGQAQQVLLLTDKYGNRVAYLFTLSRQTQSPYQDCWMTDSVMRIEMGKRIEI